MAKDLPEGQTVLFDVTADPGQMHPVHDAAVEGRMRQALIDQLKENEAPEEFYAVYGLN